MQFLQPSYFWGLFALAIPITIHLWSRKKVLTIKVGSILFIPETKSKQSNSIQLNEWLLLALRCLIISMLVTILAEPQLTKKMTQQEVAYVFEPSLLAHQDGINRFTHISLEGRRLLQTGFPEWHPDDAIVSYDTSSNYWQLAQEIDQIPADSIVVFTNAFAKALKGKRPTLSTKINWITVDDQTAVTEAVFARVVKDSLEVFSAQSDKSTLQIDRKRLGNNQVAFNLAGDSVSIDTEKGKQQVPILLMKPLHMLIVYDDDYQVERSYFEAAFRAIQNHTDQEITVDVRKYKKGISVKEVDRLIWLTNFEMVTTEMPTLAIGLDDLADRLITPSSMQSVHFLTQKLTPEVLEKEQFIRSVLDWFA